LVTSPKCTPQIRCVLSERNGSSGWDNRFSQRRRGNFSRQKDLHERLIPWNYPTVRSGNTHLQNSTARPPGQAEESSRFWRTFHDPSVDTRWPFRLTISECV